MKKIMTMARQFRDDESGAAMVEYTILLGIITAAVITLVLAVGTYISGAWGDLCGELAATATGCVTPT